MAVALQGKGGAYLGGHGVFFSGLPRPGVVEGKGIILASTHQSLSVLVGLGRRGRSVGVVVGRERRRGRRRVGTGGHWLGMWTAPVACGGRGGISMEGVGSQKELLASICLPAGGLGLAF